MKAQRKISYTVVKYHNDREMWTVVRTIEEDFAKVYSEGEANSLIYKLKKRDEGT